MKKLYYWIIDRPVIISVIILLISLIVIRELTLSFFGYNKTFWENILVEAHGMLLEVLVFGVLILWLNQKNERRRTIQGYLNDIEFFRGWVSEEGVRRTTGNIHLLNIVGVSDIDLTYCYLKKAKLVYANLSKSNISEAILEEINLFRADLSKARCIKSNMRGALLEESNLRGVIFKEADLTGANLAGADLSDANFHKANLQDVCLSIDQLMKVETLYKVKNLNSELEKQLRETNCFLLEKPNDPDLERLLVFEKGSVDNQWRRF